MPLAIGTVLENRYRIDALLGQGGVSGVYCAWDQRLHQNVAIKENALASPASGPCRAAGYGGSERSGRPISQPCGLHRDGSRGQPRRLQQRKGRDLHLYDGRSTRAGQAGQPDQDHGWSDAHHRLHLRRGLAGWWESRTRRGTGPPTATMGWAGALSWCIPMMPTDRSP